MAGTVYFRLQVMADIRPPSALGGCYDWVLLVSFLQFRLWIGHGGDWVHHATGTD